MAATLKLQSTSDSSFSDQSGPTSAKMFNMASTLAALTSITTFLAHAYFEIGQTYHSLPDPVSGLHETFTVSSNRELPDLITIFGMVEANLLRAHVVMLGGDEYALAKELWAAHDLIFEAWLKISYIDRVMAIGLGIGEYEGLVQNADGGEEFEKWRGALPDCCGMFESFVLKMK